jgi:hypothetical protein
MLKRVDKEFGCLKLLFSLLTIVGMTVRIVAELIYLTVHALFGLIFVIPLWLCLLPIRAIMAVLNVTPKPDGFIRKVSKKAGISAERILFVAGMLLSDGDYNP